jgi:ribosomal subunit interface protein
MDIIISARHMNHVSPSMKSEIETRLDKLSSMYSKLTKAEVVMEKVKTGDIAEIVLHGKGIYLEAESSISDNLYEAIHQAVDRLEKQLSKKFGKRKKKHNTLHLGNLEVELINLANAELDYEDEYEEAAQ